MEQTAFTDMSHSERTHWWFVGRRYFLYKRLEKIIDSKSLIFEVGCGTGGNLEMLKAFGTVSAIELDEQAYQLSSAHKEVACARGSLPDNNPFASQQFDIIAMFDVLEHIEDDLGALKALKQCLTEDGKIVLTVPAYKFLWSRHDDHHHHYRRYSRKSLIKLCNQAGYDVAGITGFNFLLLPVAIMVRFASKLVPMAPSSQSGSQNKVINAILKILFKAETAINNAKGWPFGLSIYAELEPK